MSVSKFVKSGIILYFSLFFTDSLKPIRLPSGQDRIYKYNREHPEFDVKRITPMEASFISRHWLNNILEPKNICEEDKLIIEKINFLEDFIQNKFTEHKEIGVEYFVWSPQCITNDILFIAVMETNESNYILSILINSPFWEFRQISTECLLESLTQYSNLRNKTLIIDDFLETDIRYKLLWKNFKTELF